jgi:hypothetical protein
LNNNPKRKKIVPIFLLLSIIIFSSIILLNNNSSSIPFVNPSYAQQQSTGNSSISYIGVDMRGFHTSLRKAPSPPNYYEDSFRILSQAGMNHVRFVFYWEAYDKDPVSFINELTTVAKTADKWGIKVLYDNHQFHTSSWLNENRGSGFPWSLFKENPSAYPQGGGGSPHDMSAKVWWTNWWDRSIKDVNGSDGWTLQANFLKKIAKAVDNYPSTLGYEILNEPQVHSIDQWSKIGTYNTFMTDQLRTVTQKTIAYSMNIPVSLKGTIGVTADNLAKMTPANKANVVFKISSYGIASSNKYQQQRLDTFIKASQLAGIPLYIGEWNNVRRVLAPTDGQGQKLTDQTFTTSPQLSDINQTEANLIVQKFKEIKAWGMAFWDWDYTQSQVPNFNLITVRADGTILTTKYFDILKNAYSNVYGNMIQ